MAAAIAAMGTLMVFLYVQGAESRANERYDAVQVLRAVKPIEAGESFDAATQASKFQLESVARDQVLDGSQTDLTSLRGLVATQAIYPGEQIIAAKWSGQVEAPTSLAIPKGMMAISVNLTDPARVAGFVNPGSEVSIFMTGDGGSSGGAPFARTLMDRVTVLGVGTTSTIKSTKTSGDGEQIVEELPRTLMTLAVKQRDAERVIFAARNGELAFGLLTKDTSLAQSPGFSQANLFQ
ncbi:MAG: Flp pilus assembly protein CpaB [Nocardioides sp.]